MCAIIRPVTANATVYAARALGVAAIRSAARTAKVASVAGDVLAVVELGPVRVTINQMPAADVAAHLAGVRTFVARSCHIDDDTVLGRIEATEQVLGLVIEPGLDTAGKTIELILALARSGHGLAFDGERFRDRDGRVLATVTNGAGFDTAEVATNPDAQVGTGEPPDAGRVLRRAQVLAAVAIRAFVEDEPQPRATETANRIGRWLAATGLDGELERDERELIDAPVGRLSLQRKDVGVWRGEGLAVLGWALGVSDLPDHATPVDAAKVASAVGLLADRRPERVDPPRVRSPAELDWMGRRLIGLHWRMRELFAAPAPVDFRSFAKNAWFGGFDLIGIPLAADDDLAVDGQPITAAAKARVVQCHSIAVERHQAIGWLRGLHPLYSKVEATI